LIDGLDGLAAGSALFSTLVVFIVALVSHSHWLALATIVLTGAILGFLRFNFNPATIFLGDSGSLFIGFLLSAFALQEPPKRLQPWPWQFLWCRLVCRSLRRGFQF